MQSPSNEILKDWWVEPEFKVEKAALAAFERLKREHSARLQNNLRFARLYGNIDILGLTATQYYRTQSANTTFLGNRLTWNVVKSLIDTVSSKIAKHKPRPVALTEGGDWALGLKAKKLSQFVQGVYYETNAYEKGANIFRDACIFGPGFFHVYRKKGRICIDRALAEELYVDPAEALYGNPQTLYREKLVERRALKKLFPEKKYAVAIASVANEATKNGSSSVSDLVLVVESWRLASEKGADDGRHCIVIDGATLEDEVYKKTYFPFLGYHWTEPVFGYYGVGLAEETIGIQVEINKLLRQIQMSHHLLSTPKVLLENGSKIVSAHINNEIGSIVRYTGIPPQIVSFQTVHPEIYQHLERLYVRAYENAGVSTLSAQSKKPAGLYSGRAIREYADIETDRFALQQQRYEQLYVKLFNVVVDLARDIVKEEGSYKVKAPNKKFVDSIDFKDCDLDEATYVLQVFPTSFLPSTPAGRISTVQEMMNAGLIDKDIGLKLLDIPDLESANSLINAAYDDAMLHIDQILTHNTYHPPEPYMNLDLAKRLAQFSYLRAKVDKVPQERLEKLRRFVDACAKLLADQTPAPAVLPEELPAPDSAQPPVAPAGLPPVAA